jgi:hypothetical protein
MEGSSQVYMEYDDVRDEGISESSSTASTRESTNPGDPL